MAKKKTTKKKITKPKVSAKQKESDSKLFAFLAVFLSIIGFIIALITKKDDKYVMYYAKQSLVLFIAYVILWVAATILTVVTFGIGAILYPIIGLLMLILWIFQIVYALSGKMQPTPIIGHYANKINL